MELEKSSQERIGFGKRLLALIIDTILSSIAGFALSLFAESSLLELFYNPSQLNDSIATFENLSSGLGNTMQEFFKVIAGIGVIGFLIMIMEGLTGQTPGKMLLGIKNANQDGSNASTSTLFIRTLIKNISSVLSFVAVTSSLSIIGTIGSFLGFIIFIGCFFTLGKSKQSIHDLISKTAVYNKSDLS